MYKFTFLFSSSISNAVKANCWNCQTDPPYPRNVQPTPRRMESPAYCCDGMPCGEFNSKQPSGNSGLKLERRNVPPNSSVNLDSRTACYNNSKDTRAAMDLFQKSNEISSSEDRSRGYPNEVKLKPRRHLENPMSNLRRPHYGPVISSAAQVWQRWHPHSPDGSTLLTWITFLEMTDWSWEKQAGSLLIGRLVLCMLCKLVL